MQSDLIEELVPELSQATIEGMKELSLDSPIARVKFWYYDTSASECYFLADVLTLKEREELLASNGTDALEDIWNENGSKEFEVDGRGNPRSQELLVAYYKVLEQDEKATQLLAQRLSWRLNETGVDGVAVTDDFIAYAQNGTDYGCDCYEDLIASVPEAKLELLRARKLMGSGENYDYLPSE